VKSLLLLSGLCCACLLEGATIRGKVLLDKTGKGVHHISVLLSPTGRVVESGEDGGFVFAGLAAGRYSLIASGEGLSAPPQDLEITEDAERTVEFRVAVTPLRQEITVSASPGKVETTLEAFSPTMTLDSTVLAAKTGTSLGDVLDGEAGVHRRSFGPGSTRPVIRGFDGDRVLILQDGMRTGTLGSQSGDHGEPVDPQGLDRVEVVRGPATLLHGSSAMGGVVNMVTGHHEARDQGHAGLHGYLSGIAGTNNGLHGGSAGVDFGAGRWVFRLGSGGQRTSDYRSAEERIFNSRTRANTGNASASYYGRQNWFTAGFSSQRAYYQLPSEPHDEDEEEEEEEEEGHGHENVALPVNRWSLRLQGGRRDVYQYGLNYADYRHKELEGAEIGTRFFNKLFDYRGLMEQKRRGPFSGSFGVWGLRRDYEAVGDEAVVPPTIQNAFSVYGVESVDLERIRFQFGGRVETNRYKPVTGRARNFTGFSGSAGITFRLDDRSALVANFSRAYRAPALEELYANGPHPGLLAFEVGDVNLERERVHGLDFSYRRQSGRVKTEFNFFRYWLASQVFLAPNGEVEDGLPVANYSQGNSTYTGFDARLDAALTSWLWLKLGFDSVRTELTAQQLSLPRTPPVRGRLGLDWRWKNWSLAPELVLAARQDRVFTNETETAGYGVANLRGGYTFVTQHAVHMFGVNWFNANNQLYRNHLSFLKAVAPEMGRGVNVHYSVRFY
jgi:iron complex outermembrane receptor protein